MRVGTRLRAVPEGCASRFGRERRERLGGDEVQRIRREHRAHERAGVDQAAADLDGLVRGDPAGDAEDDAASFQWHYASASPSPSTSASASADSSIGSALILSAAISSKAIESGF